MFMSVTELRAQIDAGKEKAWAHIRAEAERLGQVACDDDWCARQRERAVEQRRCVDATRKAPR